MNYRLGVMESLKAVLCYQVEFDCYFQNRVFADTSGNMAAAVNFERHYTMLHSLCSNIICHMICDISALSCLSK